MTIVTVLFLLTYEDSCVKNHSPFVNMKKNIIMVMVATKNLPLC